MTRAQRQVGRVVDVFSRGALPALSSIARAGWPWPARASRADGNDSAAVKRPNVSTAHARQASVANRPINPTAVEMPRTPPDGTAGRRIAPRHGVAGLREALSKRRTRTAAVGFVTAGLVAVVVQQSWAGAPVTFGTLLEFVVTGVAIGSIYGVAAEGLVLTYATSGVFNFAQGAMGMFCTFMYWQLRVDLGLQTALALLLTVLVFAPLMGIAIQRVLMRRLADVSLVAQLVTTIGLMLALIGLSVAIWNPNTTRTIDTFFGHSGFHVGQTVLPWYRLITILTGLGIGVLLRFLLHHTRLGLSMRAVVDNRDLTVLNGARPDRAAMTAWALGTSMAALAGIFLSEELNALDATNLTLFIVDAFAAGIIARLKSLPMAYFGGLIIGLSIAFQEYFLSWTGRWVSAPQAIPAVILFIAVLFVRQGRIQGRPKARPSIELTPRVRTSAIGLSMLIVLSIILAAVLSQSNVRDVTVALLTSFIMLTMVPLTGWANQVSLAQISLVGCGAFAMVEWGQSGNVLMLLVAAAFTVPIGLVMAGPALRLQGLYLALATMAFARMIEFLFFDQPLVYGDASRTIAPLRLFGRALNDPFTVLGVNFGPDSGFLIFATVIFGVVGMIVVLTRRGSFGRRLIAMRDSPAACVTLGADLTRTKFAVFAYSAAMCGLVGGLFGVYYGTVGTGDFGLTVGLPYVLLLVVGGAATVGGTVFGGVSLVSFSWIAGLFPGSVVVQWFEQVGPGLAGIGIGHNPDGVWPQQVAGFAESRRRKAAKRGGVAELPIPQDTDQRPALPKVQPRRDPSVPVLELQGISVRFGGLQAVRDVSLTLAEGTVTGLIGPNGAGKTTLFNVATGLQEPVKGRIFFDGVDVTAMRPHLLARRGLVRTFQLLETFGSLTVRENIRVAAEMRRSWSRDRTLDPEAVAESIVDLVGLRYVAKVRSDTLPTGTARLLEVGRALAAQPRVLLLDEPSSGLSASESEVLVALLRELSGSGITILVVEHDMEFIMGLCARVVVLDAGEVIADGTPAEVQQSPQVLAAYLGGDGAGGSETSRPRTATADLAASKPSATGRAAAPRSVPAEGTASANGRAAAPGAPAALELNGVTAAYGSIEVLVDLDLCLEPGQVCALLGPNGAGKSTTLKVASGQLRPTSGTVTVEGHPIADKATDSLVRNGLGMVPEGRGIFPNLTVAENLKMASYAGVDFDEIQASAFDRFPILASRRRQLAGTLSGGEQQMLAIARALAVKPRILLLDELSMGLAPIIVSQIYELIEAIAHEGMPMLIVEQFAHEVLKVADVAALLVNGRIVHQGTPAEIGEVLDSAYLGRVPS